MTRLEAGLGIAMALAFAAEHARRWRSIQPLEEPPTCDWQPPVHGPRVSFLVPAWNAANDIVPFVRAFQGLNYPNKELILCAGGADGSLDLAHNCSEAGVIVLEQHPGEGKQRALHRCYAASTGDVIYLTDADSRPTSAVVNNLLRHIVDDGASAVTGASRPLDSQVGNRLIRAQWSQDRLMGATPRPATGIHGCHAALTRETVEAAGAFHDDVPSGTDYALAKEVIRAGRKILFVPGDPMPTAYPATVREHVRKQRRWLRNEYVLGRNFGAHSEARSALTAIGGACLLPALLAALLLQVPLSAVSCLLLFVHPLLNRVGRMRRAGLSISPLGSLQHYLAVQVACLLAGFDILRGRAEW